MVMCDSVGKVQYGDNCMSAAARASTADLKLVF